MCLFYTGSPNMNMIFGLFLLLVSPSLGQVDNLFASFIAKICLSDSDCGRDEQCQLPFAGVLAGLPKSPLILAIQAFSLRTCGPRLSPPVGGHNTDRTGRVRADGFFIPADESMDGFYQAPPYQTTENLFGVPLNAIVPDLGLGIISAPSIVCRAFQRDLNVGDSIGINAMGFANDLFNVTIPDGVSADTILIHVKELQTMVKVPGTFQFTCDAPGAFSLKFKVFVTDVDGGFVGKGYRTCKSLITCSLPLSTTQPTTLSDQEPNVVFPPAWQLPPPGYPNRLTQSYGPGAPPYGIPTDALPGARIPLGTVSQRQIDEFPENQSEDVYRNMFLAYEESENRADIANALETEAVVERPHESVPPTTVMQAVNPPEITCHDLSVDAKLHRDIALSLPGSLYSIKTDPGKTAKTKVLIPGYDGDASIFPYTCTEPGLFIRPAAILAELEGLNDFKHCPLKISKSNFEPISFRLCQKHTSRDTMSKRPVNTSYISWRNSKYGDPESFELVVPCVGP